MGSTRDSSGAEKIGRRANTNTNVSRYSASGTTQSNGMEATSVVMNVVTPRSKLDGTAAQVAQ